MIVVCKSVVCKMQNNKNRMQKQNQREENWEVQDHWSGMATREGNPQIPKKKLPLFPLLSLLSFTSIFFLLSLFNSTSTSTPRSYLPTFKINNQRHASCDFSDGTWIHDPSRTPTYDNTCKEIFKGWNCRNKSNAPLLATWRWQPRHCDLPQFQPLEFLRNHPNTAIGTLCSCNKESCVLFGILNDGCLAVQVLLGILSIGTCLCRSSVLLRVSPMDKLRSGDPLALTVDSPFLLIISPLLITAPIFSLVMVGKLAVTICSVQVIFQDWEMIATHSFEHTLWDGLVEIY